MSYTKKEKYHKKALNYLIRFLFRRQYIGFYFWNSKNTNLKGNTIDIIIGKILFLLLILSAGVTFAIIIIFNLNEKIQITPNKEYKPILLGGIVIIAYFLSKKLENYIKRIITDRYIKTINLKKYSKKSALPYFITTFTDYFIMFCVLILMMKLFAILK